MAFLEWDEKYSVGIEEIDQQHKRLFDLINKLYGTVQKVNGANDLQSSIIELSAILAAVDKMEDYASYHFSTEENYMLEYSYPDYKAHKKAHDLFFESVRKFKREIDEGKGFKLTDILEYLKKWLTGHVLTTDQKYRKFFKKKGLS
ncbi:bacteriohemerythrin [bacterium BMS3Abin01]|nr:bacteriohemerythrin [bacterium BMS3Abin01]